MFNVGDRTNCAFTLARGGEQGADIWADATELPTRNVRTPGGIREVPKEVRMVSTTLAVTGTVLIATARIIDILSKR